MESLCSVLIWTPAIQGERFPFTPPPSGILPFPLLWTVIPPVRRLTDWWLTAQLRHMHRALHPAYLSKPWKRLSPEMDLFIDTKSHVVKWGLSLDHDSGALGSILEFLLMCWVTLGKPATRCRSVSSSARVDTSTLTKYSRVLGEENVFHKAVYLCKSQLSSPVGRLH